MATETKNYVPSLIAKRPDPAIKLVVALPTHDTMEAGFAYDLAKMMSRLGASVVADGVMDIRTFMIQGTLVHTARNDIVKDVLQNTDATHVLWLDTDMRFPWQTPLRLLNHGKDIVGCNYSTRKGLPKPTAFRDINADKDDKYARFVFPETPAPTGPAALIKVSAVGMGVCLVRREVYEAIKYPWFETVYDHVNHRWVGEDVDFCRKAAAAGFDTYCDLALSEELAHIGRFEYQLEHVRAAEEASLIVRPETPKIVAP